MDKYAKLNKVENYDHEAAEQLASAINEIADLEAQAAALKDLVSENKELHQYIWKTAEGKAIAIHDLEDEHLKNILQHLFNNRRSISKIIKAEARKRGITIPTNYVPISYSRSNRITEGVVVSRGDDDDIDLTEIPF